MKGSIDMAGASLYDAGFTPVAASGTGFSTTVKFGAGQLFRFRVAITLTSFTSVAGVDAVAAIVMPPSAFRISSLAVELVSLTVTGSPLNLSPVSVSYAGKELMTQAGGSFTSTTYNTGTQKRWFVMSQSPGGDAGTGGTGNDGYFIDTNGQEAVFYGGSFLGGSMTVSLAHSSATGVANASMNLHICGNYLS